jgi:hypothetical protein
MARSVFDRGEFGFGKKLRAWKPIQYCFVKRILSAHTRAKDPDCFPQAAPDNGSEKRLGRRDDVRELYRRSFCPDLLEFARDRFGLRDSFDQFAGC